MNVHSRTPCDAGAAEDTVDGDAAKRMLRSVVREAPSDVLVSVLAEELTDAQLEELIAKRRRAVSRPPSAGFGAKGKQGRKVQRSHSHHF